MESQFPQTVAVLQQKGFFCGREYNYPILVMSTVNAAAYALGGVIGAAIAEGTGGGSRVYLMNFTESGMFRVELGRKYAYEGTVPEFEDWGQIAEVKFCRVNLGMTKALKFHYLNGKKVTYTVIPKLKNFPELADCTQKFETFLGAKFPKSK